jgi:hypothetical protein
LFEQSINQEREKRVADIMKREREGKRWCAFVSLVRVKDALVTGYPPCSTTAVRHSKRSSRKGAKKLREGPKTDKKRQVRRPGKNDTR